VSSHIMNKKKVMYSVEFPIRCSPSILYEFLSTPVGLQEWFADKVDQRENRFYFTWNGSTDTAEILEHLDNEFIRYRWDYYPKDEFFEFSIEQSLVTNETILRITDFADKSDIKDQEQLWVSQIQDLKHRIGS
jgi:uncharacterized protein YndB with AHSA1/START domain